jgi:hypothetical protein
VIHLLFLMRIATAQHVISGIPIHMSHDRMKPRKCALELRAEFGTELPPGLKTDRVVAVDKR